MLIFSTAAVDRDLIMRCVGGVFVGGTSGLGLGHQAACRTLSGSLAASSLSAGTGSPEPSNSNVQVVTGERPRPVRSPLEY
jgi:hypothetical protein